MKTRTRQGQGHLGAYNLIRQRREERLWVEGDVTSRWNGTWKMDMRLPGGVKKFATVTGAAICPACLAVEGSPTRVRSECRCQKYAHSVAGPLLKQAVVDQIRGKEEAEVQAKERSREPTIGEAEAVALAHVPLHGRVNHVRSWDRLKGFVEEVTGRPAEGQVFSEVLTWPNALAWARMRQEHGRRGWNERGGAWKETVKDPWGVLRAELKANRLPPIDKVHVRPWNTTILGTLNTIRSCVGRKARSEYLVGLTLPPLVDFRDGTLTLPTPDGHQDMAPEVYRAMYEGVPRLREENLQLWLVGQMFWRFGLRPCEASASRSDWVERDGEGSILVVRSEVDGPVFQTGKRKGKEFLTKAGSKPGHKETVRRFRIPSDVWEVMESLMVPSGSLLGCSTTARAEELVDKVHSEWVRRFVGAKSKHTNYLLRHNAGQRVRELYGEEMAAGFLGHSTTAGLTGGRANTTQMVYTKFNKVLPALTWEDLRPEA